MNLNDLERTYIFVILFNCGITDVGLKKNATRVYIQIREFVWLIYFSGLSCDAVEMGRLGKFWD